MIIITNMIMIVIIIVIMIMMTMSLFVMMFFGVVVVVVVVVVLVCGFYLNLSYATCNRLYFGAAWPMGCCSISGTASRQTQTNGD